MAALARVQEVQPEVCFTYWNSGKPMDYRKLSGFGFMKRIKLVGQRYPGVMERIRRAFTVSDVGEDDILDALAALWTAERLASDRDVRIGPDDAKDECGIPMNIWA